MDDCPAVLSLGILVRKLGWSYEWTQGEKPILSRGTIKLALEPHHDVPMVFAAQINGNSGNNGNIEGDEVNSASESTSASSGEGRPSATDSEERSSASSSEEPSSQSTSGEMTPTLSSASSQSGNSKWQSWQKTKKNKQRFVKSRYTKAPSARHNLYTHFPLDKNCEV